MNAAGNRNATSSAAPTMACQLNRIISPPARSITPLTGTPMPAAGTPLDCAYPVRAARFRKWFTPADRKNALKPMRPTQVRMVQRSMAALLWVGGVNDRGCVNNRGGSEPNVGAQHAAPLLVALALAACSSAHVAG